MIHFRTGYAIDWAPSQLLVEYVFKEKEKDVFQVSKFLESKQPVAVYIVKRRTTNSYYCDCMRGERGERCRHADLVEQWLQQGREVPSCFTFKEYSNEASISKERKGDRPTNSAGHVERHNNLRFGVRVDSKDKGDARSPNRQRRSIVNAGSHVYRRASGKKQKSRSRNKRTR